MNKFFIMMIGLLFTASAVFASPNAKADFVTLDKVDSQVLFGDSAVSVVTLGHDEMMATEGEYIRRLYNGARYIYRNTNIDGYNGSRLFQVRWKKRPVFRADYKANPSPAKLHFHYGNMKSHRPWYAPWRRY